MKARSLLFVLMCHGMKVRVRWLMMLLRVRTRLTGRTPHGSSQRKPLVFSSRTGNPL
jgi:hypothetical protein